MTRRPCSVSSSARSTIIFTTIAVLLITKVPDSATAVCQLMSQTRPTKRDSSIMPMNDSSMHSTTCASPSPNTNLRIARNLGRLKSRPMANIRNTTPNSPRWRTPSELLASASA